MDDKNLIDQADALMNRWRRLPAEPEPEPASPQTMAVDEAPGHDADDDIPVLTEAVADQPPIPVLSDIQQPQEDPPPPQPAALPSQQLQEQLQSQMEAWLDHALPEAVLRVLDGLADQLIGQIGQQARQALLPQLLLAIAPPPADTEGDTASAVKPPFTPEA